jgi:hypothetical protein
LLCWPHNAGSQNVMETAEPSARTQRLEIIRIQKLKIWIYVLAACDMERVQNRRGHVERLQGCDDNS